MAKIPGKTEGPGLIYICHMDTVMLGDGWDEDISPLGAMVRDGKMYGRGACDMKSGLACCCPLLSWLPEHSRLLARSKKEPQTHLFHG